MPQNQDKIVALESLYRSKRKTYLYKIKSIVHDYEIAEEIVQNAFTKALTRIATYDSKKSSLNTWVSSILFSTLWSWKKYLNKEPRFVDIMSCEDKLELSSVQEENLESLISIKNPLHQKIIVDCVVLGLNTQEVACDLGVTQANVRKVLERFRKTQ
jgi:RNA polymerase sigma factor (sigma-70 family)